MPRFVNKLAANLGALNKLWSEPVDGSRRAQRGLCQAEAPRTHPRTHARTHARAHPTSSLPHIVTSPVSPLLQFTSAEIDTLRADTLAMVNDAIAAQQLQPLPS